MSDQPHETTADGTTEALPVTASAAPAVDTPLETPPAVSHAVQVVPVAPAVPVAPVVAAVPVAQPQPVGWAPQAVLTDQRDPGGGVVVVAWICAVITFAYMLPWAIAATRGRSNQGTIGLINLLLGWSFVGWVIALVMACQSHSPVLAVPVAGYAVPQGGAPAGWYPSPSGVGQEYWDGARWTGHRAP